MYQNMLELLCLDNHYRVIILCGTGYSRHNKRKNVTNHKRNGRTDGRTARRSDDAGLCATSVCQTQTRRAVTTATTASEFPLDFIIHLYSLSPSC